MRTLVRKNEENGFYDLKEVYEGTTSRVNKKTYEYEEVKVWCCLDDYCVRYTITINGKCKSRREFRNDQKELCFKNANKALEKYSK